MGGSLTINTPGANGGLEVPRTCGGENNSVGDNNVDNNTTSGREKTDTLVATPPKANISLVCR